jgi:dihydroflavonol-4-reductase
MTTVLLTGASGFLGAHLLHALRAAGHNVRALSRRPESDAAIAATGATPVRASLADRDALQAALYGCSAVFHAAADTSMWRPHAVRQTATNVDGTENLLRAAEAAGVEAFMHTSSVSAWSHRVYGIIDESTGQLGGASWINYERSKFLGEQIVRGSSLPWIVFNPSHILGPGDRHNWARLIMLIDRGKLPDIPPGIGACAVARVAAPAVWAHLPARRRTGQLRRVGAPRRRGAGPTHSARCHASLVADGGRAVERRLVADQWPGA